MTNRAIWIDDPTATEIERSILSFTDTDTAVKCSAAFPTWALAFYLLYLSSDLFFFWIEEEGKVGNSKKKGKKVHTIGSKINPTHSLDKDG